MPSRFNDDGIKAPPLSQCPCQWCRQRRGELELAKRIEAEDPGSRFKLGQRNGKKKG
jgi:hypothetical protein